MLFFTIFITFIILSSLILHKKEEFVNRVLKSVVELNSDMQPIKNGLSTARPITLLNGWQANGQIRYVVVANLLLINGNIRNGDTAVNTILASGLPTGYFGVQANPTYTIAGGLIALRDNGELYIVSSNGAADIRINLIAIKP